MIVRHEHRVRAWILVGGKKKKKKKKTEYAIFDRDVMLCIIKRKLGFFGL